jgi:hypothetical protein
MVRISCICCPSGFPPIWSVQVIDMLSRSVLELTDPPVALLGIWYDGVFISGYQG